MCVSGEAACYDISAAGSPQAMNGGRHMTVDEKINELMHHYQASCRAIARNLVQDYDAAEDVVQDAFVRAYLALRSYAPERVEALQARAWLHRIVVNEARRYLAGRRDLVRLDNEEGKWVYELEGPEQEHPEVSILYAEEKKLLDELLSLLPPTSQEVIEFWVRFGGSYQDIAQAFDSDVRTIRTRFHRATQRLKNMVREKDVRESELKRWLHANLLELEEEWQVWRRHFSLRDYIKGEAYANMFGGHPYRGQFMRSE